MKKLIVPKSCWVADQCREMGIKEHDFIIGGEVFDDIDYIDVRILSPVFIGEKNVVFKQIIMNETNSTPLGFTVNETSQFTLAVRQWWKL